jgi:hypothetical protein
MLSGRRLGFHPGGFPEGDAAGKADEFRDP